MTKPLEELLKTCELYFNDPHLEEFNNSSNPENYHYLLDLAEEISSQSAILFITSDNDFHRDHIEYFNQHGYIVGISLKQADGKRLGAIQKGKYRVMF